MTTIFGGIVMKPIFGVDITENKKNERVCGAIFAARTVSPDAGKRLETSVDKLEDVKFCMEHGASLITANNPLPMIEYMEELGQI